MRIPAPHVIDKINQERENRESWDRRPHVERPSNRPPLPEPDHDKDERSDRGTVTLVF